MILYVDSTSICSIHLREANRHETVKKITHACSAVACSHITYVEVLSALARARFKENPPRIRPDHYIRAKRDFISDWTTYGRVDISRGLLESAGHLAEEHRLRGYDAVHLASMVALRDRQRDAVHVSTWDRDLAQAAASEGFVLAHEVNT